MNKKSILLTLAIVTILVASSIVLITNNNKEGNNKTNVNTENQVVDKNTAIKLVQEYIRENNITVIDISVPIDIREDKDNGIWSMSFEIEQEPVPLPPFRSFNVHKDGRTYEVPRL